MFRISLVGRGGFTLEYLYAILHERNIYLE